MFDMKAFMSHDTVALDNERNELVIIDQTFLPGHFHLARLQSQQDIWQAVRSLKVRGAPALGVASAFALYLAARQYDDRDVPRFKSYLAQAAHYLNSARPTAVNLSWALKRMLACLEEESNRKKDVPALNQVLYQEAMAIRNEDVQVCRAIGQHGLSLLQNGFHVLTHCNAGRLATVKYGTATAPLYLGHEQGLKFKVFADETRPLLQGARLTALELMAAGLDVTLICDNMAATLLQAGRIDAIVVGCDRVAANGDAANKIGTLPLAIVARHYKVPIYFCAPTSTIDMNTPQGGDIVIEERPGEEITDMWYQEPMAPEGCRTFNPAFDVTGHSLISAFITECGIVRPPFAENFARLFV